MLRLSVGLAGWVVAMPATSNEPVCSSSSSSRSGNQTDEMLVGKGVRVMQHVHADS
jgi:hypothetical protein